MSADEVPPVDPADYPGVALAYDIAVESYALAERRRDAVHQRIDTLLSFVTTVTVAALIVVVSVFENPDLRSPLLWAAGGVYVLLVLAGLAARSWGSLRQISPKLLYEQWLHLDEAEFRNRMIYWAGEHAAEAQKVTIRKATAATGMATLFVVEGALFLIWLIRMAQGT